MNAKGLAPVSLYQFPALLSTFKTQQEELVALHCRVYKLHQEMSIWKAECDALKAVMTPMEQYIFMEERHALMDKINQSKEQTTTK